jgi:hypothetical protein
MAQPLQIEEKERIERTVLTAIELDAAHNKAEAARIAGISHTELNNLLDQRPAFARRFRAALAAAREHVVDQVESAMVQRALDVKNPVGVTAGIFYLKSHRAHIYADRPQGLNLTVNIDKAQVNLAGQTVDEMRKLEGKLDDGPE